MARARGIKPSLFKNELLGEADPILTILFVGLWCLADRDGKLEDRPKRIEAEIFPYREISDINGYLTELERLEFIHRYSVENQPFILVKNFQKHQSPHKTERPSEIPDPPVIQPDKSNGCLLTVNKPLKNQTITVKESLITDNCLLITDSLERGAVSATQPPPTKVEAKKPNGKFHKPGIREIREYCESIGSKVNPVAFFNHYESNGWKVGKNSMKNWQAAIRHWSARE